MQVAIERSLYDGMKHEQDREGPPLGFPELPLIPGGRYTDPAFLELELQYLWKRSWLYALHVDELPRPGSYRLWRKTGAPIIIVRDRENRIRAFYNTCRHRGAPLVEKEQGETKGFFCRYHGWTYDLGGRLTAVREKRDFPGMDTTCFGLNEVRCEQFGNFVFVNEDPGAPPLLESLGPIPRHLENLGFDSIRHIASSSFEIACNVKILLDAFLETYHLKSIHPQTVDRFLDSRGTHIVMWRSGHSMMCTPHRRAEWRDPGAVGMPEVATAEQIFHSQNPSYNFYPNLITPPAATGTPVITFWPRTPRSGRRACRTSSASSRRTRSSRRASRNRWKRRDSRASTSPTRSDASTTGTRNSTDASARNACRQSCACGPRWIAGLRRTDRRSGNRGQAA
jgi:phenylpropionate dioxygenase-like ring-hydroxylating dioxygenase large terminal subunit